MDPIMPHHCNKLMMMMAGSKFSARPSRAATGRGGGDKTRPPRLKKKFGTAAFCIPQFKAIQTFDHSE
jgi:hypothetical protein